MKKQYSLRAPKGVLPLGFDIGRHLSGELPAWLGMTKEQLAVVIRREGPIGLTLRGKYRPKGKRQLQAWEHRVVLLGPFDSVEAFLYSVHRALRAKIKKL